MSFSREQILTLAQTITDCLADMGKDYYRSQENEWPDNKQEIIFEPLGGTGGPEIKLLLEDK